MSSSALLQARSTRIKSRIVLSGDDPLEVPGVDYTSLSDADEARLRQLVITAMDRETGALMVRRNRSYTVGQLEFRGSTIVVPPTITGSLFMVFFLNSLAPTDSRLTRRFIRELETEAGLAPEEWASYFDVLIAHLYVRWTERILASHIAQTYVRQEERLHVLRGKPLWAKNMGRHPAEGVACRYFELQTDNVFNRMVLSGLIKAATILRGTQWDEGVQNQLFIWHTLAHVVIPRPEMFVAAYTKLSRITEHYRPVLRLGEALLFGHAPRDLFAGGRQWLQGFYFDVPTLYERFLAHLLREALRPYGLGVKEQFAQHGAFVDATDQRYRSVRPDIVIFRGDQPVAIIDAKYKPQYLEGGGSTRLPARNKVSSEDLYQMFFYQARLRYKYGLTESIPSALVSPSLPRAGDLPHKRLRTIGWKAGDAPDVHTLEVLNLPLEPVLQKLADGGSASHALDEASELRTFVESIVR